MTLVGMGTNPPPGGHGGLRMPWGFSHGLPWLLPAAVCLSCVQASFPLVPTLSPDTRAWGRNEYIRSGVYGSVGIHVHWVRKEITPKILDLGSATLGFPLGVTRSAFVLQIQKAFVYLYIANTLGFNITSRETKRSLFTASTLPHGAPAPPARP